MIEPTRQGTPLDVRSISATRWLLLSPFSRLTRDGRRFDVNAGDTTDFASVPALTQVILPKTGAWSKAATGHDKRCDLLNAVHQDREAQRYFGWHGSDQGWVPPEGWFNSVDTDRIFREDARDDGTDVVRAELLWFGVRTGALINPARREGWLSTAPRYLADLIAILVVLVAVVAGLSWVWPW